MTSGQGLLCVPHCITLELCCSVCFTLLDELVVNPGLAAIWEDEKQRRREEGRTSQITPQSSQGRLLASPTDSEAFFKQKLHEKLLLLNSQVCVCVCVCK